MSRLRKVIALLITMIMLFSTVAYAGSDVDTGGVGTDPTGKTKGTAWTGNVAGGYKISLLYLAKDTYTPTQGDAPLANKTPIGFTDGAVPSNWATSNGSYGVLPIYFIKGDNTKLISGERGLTGGLKYGNLAWTADNKKSKAETKSVSQADIVKAITRLETKVKVQADSKRLVDLMTSAFQRDTNKVVPSINGILKLKQKSEANEEEKLWNKAVFDTLINIMASKYNASTQAQQILKRALTYDNDYTLLIEPLTTIQHTDRTYWLTTPNSFAQAYIGSAGVGKAGIWVVKSATDFVELKGSKNDTKGYNYNNIYHIIMGGIKTNSASRIQSSRTLSNVNDISKTELISKRESIASKVAYIGPLKNEGDTVKYASFADKKWGWGTLASSEYITSGLSAVTSVNYFNDDKTMAAIDYIGNLDGNIASLNWLSKNVASGALALASTSSRYAALEKSLEGKDASERQKTIDAMFNTGDTKEIIVKEFEDKIKYLRRMAPQKTSESELPWALDSLKVLEDILGTGANEDELNKISSQIVFFNTYSAFDDYIDTDSLNELASIIKKIIIQGYYSGKINIDISKYIDSGSILAINQDILKNGTSKPLGSGYYTLDVEDIPADAQLRINEVLADKLDKPLISMFNAKAEMKLSNWDYLTGEEQGIELPKTFVNTIAKYYTEVLVRGITDKWSNNPLSTSETALKELFGLKEVNGELIYKDGNGKFEIAIEINRNKEPHYIEEKDYKDNLTKYRVYIPPANRITINGKQYEEFTWTSAPIKQEEFAEYQVKIESVLGLLNYMDEKFYQKFNGAIDPYYSDNYNENMIYGEYKEGQGYKQTTVSDAAIGNIFDIYSIGVLALNTKLEFTSGIKETPYEAIKDYITNFAPLMYTQKTDSAAISNKPQAGNMNPAEEQVIFDENQVVKTTTLYNMLDAIPINGIKLQEGIDSKKKIPTIKVDGSWGVSINAYDKGIPVDFMMVGIDEEGKISILDYIPNKNYLIPGFAQNIRIPETVSGLKTSIDIKNVAVKPAGIEVTKFVDEFSKAVVDKKDKVIIDSKVSTIANAPFEYTYKWLADANRDKNIYGVDTIENTVRMAVTEKDKQVFNNSADQRVAKDRVIMIAYVEESPSIAQINIVEDSSGNVKSIEELEPLIKDGVVTLESPPSPQLKEWKKSDVILSTSNIDWNKVNVGTTNLGTGISSTVNVDTSKEKVIYVRYVEASIKGDITLTQKRITKTFDLSNIGGVKEFKFSYGSAGKHAHWVSSINGGYYTYHDRSSAVDPEYKYIIENNKPINTKAIANGTGFIPVHQNNEKSGTANWSGGSDTVNPNLSFAAFRGKDLPTIASYKEGSNPLASLGIKAGKVPQTGRASGNYAEKFEINMAKSGKGDYSTSFTDGDSVKNQAHNTMGQAPYNSVLAVNVMLGSANKGQAKSSLNVTNFKIGNISFNNAKGYAVNNTNLIKFYPYVEMLYDTNSTKDNKINVLAGHESLIAPVDFVDIGWFNSNPNASLNITSSQWSSHAKAVSKWGKNNVLPGGSIYNLDTKQNETKVGISTWQTYIPNDQLDNVTLGDNYYKLPSVNNRDTSFVTEVKKSIDSLDITQYLEKDLNKANAFSGLKLNGSGGQRITYNNQTTTGDWKYWLKKNTAITAKGGGEADLDVETESTKKTYYKVKADINGNVYVEKSSDGATWSKLQQLSKVQNAGSLTGEAKELDDRTKVVTNFILGIDRNMGNDPSIADPKWYNEAFDGINIVKTDTILGIGIKAPVSRAAAIDTKLMPPRSSQSDLFSTAYLSGFKLEAKSGIRAPKGGGYVGTLGTTGIAIPNMDKMYQSRKFYIPNTSVMDLN